MSVRTLGIGAAIVAAAVVALVLALSDGDKPASSGGDPDGADVAQSATPAPTAAAGAPPPVAPTRDRMPPPSLPTRAADDKPPAMDTTGFGQTPLWTAFDDETRDASWATDQELAIRNRLRPLLSAANRGRPGAVRVPQVSCKRALCRILVTGADQTQFQTFVESLQDERGFYGDAATLALDAYGETTSKESGDQIYQVRVHLKYER